MSEQHYQRDQNGHEEPPNDDPLAELARIVSGEDETPPAPPAASIHQVAQDAAAKPAPVAPMQSPLADSVAEGAEAPVAPSTPRPEATLPDEGMDLESQLMAELGGEPDIAVPHQPQEYFTAPEQSENQVELAVEQPAESPQPHIADEMEVETAQEVRQEQAPEIDFESALEQQLLLSSDQAATDAELPVAMEEHAIPVAQSAAPIDMEPVLPAVESPTIEELSADELDFVAAFDSELGQSQPVGSGIDDALPVMAAESALESDVEPAIAQFSTEVDGLQPETPVEQPQPLQFQSAPDFNQRQQQIGGSAGDLHNDLDDGLDMEDAFANAFADELSLEMSTEQPDSFEQQSVPIANMETGISEIAGLQGTELPSELPGAAYYSANEYQQPNAQDTAVDQTSGNPPEDQVFHDQMATSADNMVADENMAGVVGVDAGYELPRELPLEEPAEYSATGSGQLEMDQLQSEPEIIVPPARKNSGFRLAAIALGLAIVAGVGVVGYGFIGEAENTGEPTLVRADQSDFKIRPEKPGGKKIANQDQPVYDNMAGNKPSNSGQEKLIAANDEPVEVAPNNVTARPAKSAERLATGDNAPTQNTAIAVMQPRKVKTVTVRADGTIITSTGKQIADLSAITPAPVTPAPTTPAPTTPEKLASAQTAVDNSIDGAATTGKIAIPHVNPKQKSKISEIALAMPTNKNVPGNPVVLATRSLKKPDPVTSTQKPAPIVARSPVVTAPVSTPTSTPVPAGSYVVQISSQRSMEAAEATYQNLKRRFASLLSGQPREIREAKVEGKGTFYRVRIPIGTKTAANNFCGRYKSAGGSCFVTK